MGRTSYVVKHSRFNILLHPIFSLIYINVNSTKRTLLIIKDTISGWKRCIILKHNTKPDFQFKNRWVSNNTNDLPENILQVFMSNPHHVSNFRIICQEKIILFTFRKHRRLWRSRRSVPYLSKEEGFSTFTGLWRLGEQFSCQSQFKRQITPKEDFSPISPDRFVFCSPIFGQFCSRRIICRTNIDI